MVSTIDRFRIQEEIGRTGISTVYRAYDPKLDRDVALKQVRLPRSREENRRKVLEEARVVARLASSSIVSVHDIIEHDDDLLIVMEFLEGTTLDGYVDRHTFSAEEAVRFMITMCRAVKVVHDEGILHHDIKPSNIIVGKAGPKLFDFGIARREGENFTAQWGTTKYMAPEWWTEGFSGDKCSDVYSLGFTFYEALIGPAALATQLGEMTPPQWSAWHRNLRVQLKPAREIRPDLPQDLSDLVEQMMKKDRTQRIRTMDEALEVLQRIADRMRLPSEGDWVPADAPAPQAQDATAPVSRRQPDGAVTSPVRPARAESGPAVGVSSITSLLKKRWVPAAVGAGVVLAVLGIVFWFLHGDEFSSMLSAARLEFGAGRYRQAADLYDRARTLRANRKNSPEYEVADCGWRRCVAVMALGQADQAAKSQDWETAVKEVSKAQAHRTVLASSEIERLDSLELLTKFESLLRVAYIAMQRGSLPEPENAVQQLQALQGLSSDQQSRRDEVVSFQRFLDRWSQANRWELQAARDQQAAPEEKSRAQAAVKNLDSAIGVLASMKDEDFPLLRTSADWPEISRVLGEILRGLRVLGGEATEVARSLELQLQPEPHQDIDQFIQGLRQKRVLQELHENRVQWLTKKKETLERQLASLDWDATFEAGLRAFDFDKCQVIIDEIRASNRADAEQRGTSLSERLAAARQDHADFLAVMEVVGAARGGAAGAYEKAVRELDGYLAAHPEGLHLAEANEKKRELLLGQRETYTSMIERAKAAQNRGEHDTAAAILKGARDFMPGWPEAYAPLGASLRELGKLRESLAVLDEVLSRIDREDGPAFLERAETYIRMNRAREAIADISSALARLPETEREQRARAYCLRGDAYRAMGDLAGAEKDYRFAIELAESLPLYLKLGEAMLDLGRFQDARDTLVRAVKSGDPQKVTDQAAAFYLLSRCCCAMGESAEAVQYLARALRSNYGDLSSILQDPLTRTPTQHAALKRIVGETQFEPISHDRLFLSLRKIHEMPIVADMIFIPGGEFDQGASDESARPDERPQTRVRLGAFYIDRHEVTNAQYSRFLEAAAEEDASAWMTELDLPPDKNFEPAFWHDPKFGTDRPDLPVCGVDWFDAQAYAVWAEKLLPTEAQWERAAGAGQSHAYPWGDAIPLSKSVNIDRVFSGLREVGTSPGDVTAEQLMDLGGNVSEWCLDYYDERAYHKRGDMTIDPVRLKAPDETDAANSVITDHVVRGAAWDLKVNQALVTRRNHLPPLTRETNLGFRCVRPADPELVKFKLEIPVQLPDSEAASDGH